MNGMDNARDSENFSTSEQVCRRLQKIPRREEFTPEPSPVDPALLLNYRVWNQAVLCRVSELGLAALELRRQNQAVSAAILTRAIFETVALYYHIKEVLKEAVNTGKTNDAINKLWKAGLGRNRKLKLKNKQENTRAQGYNAIKFKKFAEDLRNLAPEAQDAYGELSEIVHPNNEGCVNAYATPGQENLSFKFTGDFSYIESQFGHVLSFSLQFFENTRKDMDGLMEKFIQVHAMNLNNSDNNDAT